MVHKTLKNLVVALGLSVATGSVMANDYIPPMQASASVVNVFHRVGNVDTLAKNYFVKFSSPLTPEIYELRRCPNNKTTCPGEELEKQAFWKNTGLTGDLQHVFAEQPSGNYLYFSERAWNSSTGKYDIISRQCTAFAKRLGKNSTGTSKWYRGNHIESSLTGMTHEQAIARDRGKIVMYFGNSQTGQYPQVGASVAGHVGMIVDYIYSNGKSVGM